MQRGLAAALSAVKPEVACEEAMAARAEDRGSVRRASSTRVLDPPETERKPRYPLESCV